MNSEDDPKLQAAAIVAEVLVHFGCGWGRHRPDNIPDGSPATRQKSIFDDGAFKRFFDQLVTSTVNHVLTQSPDGQKAAREFANYVAYEHGKLAMSEAGADQRLTYDEIYVTWQKVKELCGEEGRVCQGIVP